MLHKACVFLFETLFIMEQLYQTQYVRLGELSYGQ